MNSISKTKIFLLYFGFVLLLFFFLKQLIVLYLPVFLGDTNSSFSFFLYTVFILLFILLLFGFLFYNYLNNIKYIKKLIDSLLSEKKKKIVFFPLYINYFNIIILPVLIIYAFLYFIYVFIFVYFFGKFKE
jgi:hypothetical protein